MSISVILPTYNEKKNIIILVKKIFFYLKSYNSKKEIIIVDDNSPDQTYEYCKKKFIKNKKIRIYKRKKKKGLAFSIKKGIQLSKCGLIIVMDKDLTHDPAMLPKMIKLSKRYDLVICSRYCNNGGMDSFPLHYFCSYFFNIFITFFLKTGVRDNLGGYFLVKKKKIKESINKKIFYGYGDYFIRLIFFLKKKKIKIKEIPTIFKKKKYGF